jgi:hypothetical protein
MSGSRLTGFWVRGSLNFQIPSAVGGALGGATVAVVGGVGGVGGVAAAASPFADAPGIAAGPAPACGKKNTATTTTTITPANNPNFASFAMIDSP